MDCVEASHPFDQYVRQHDDEIRLAHAALLWARDEYPEMAPAQYLGRLNALADRLPADDLQTGYERADAMRRMLASEESFNGNYTNFSHPANSYLNRVIDTRRGIPVSLSVIWLDIAERLGWPFHGVNLPGHFIIRYHALGEDILIDPFNGGQEITREHCAKMIEAITSAEVELTDEHFEPVNWRTILQRMLGNLYATYTRENDWLRGARVVERIAALQPKDALVRAELGRLQMLGGDVRLAAASLNQAETLATDDQERAAIEHHKEQLRNRLTERN